MDLLIEYLSRRYRRVVEVGIGTYSRVACVLRDRGLIVTATDINPRMEGVPVVRDDLWEPRLEVYRDAQAIYAIRPPPELLPPLKKLARRLAVDLIVKPLAGEPCDGSLVTLSGNFLYVYGFGRFSSSSITPLLHHSRIPFMREPSIP
jgi:uncharacterized UPF0146 family protein